MKKVFLTQQVKNNYANALIVTGAIQIRSIDEEPFTLRSGKLSHVYVNHAKLASSAHAYISFIDAIQALVQEHFQTTSFILCNVDSKISAQMVGSLAYILKKPQIIFKSKQLTLTEKGASEQVTGNHDSNLPVAIIDDVATGGDGTASNVGELVKQVFPLIQDIQIFTGLMRNKEKQPPTFPLHSVFSFEEVISTIWDSLSEGQRKAVEKEQKGT